MRSRRTRVVKLGEEPDCSIETSNGEVEGPRAGARLEPRVRTLFPHPRRHYRLSQTSPTIVEGPPRSPRSSAAGGQCLQRPWRGYTGRSRSPPTIMASSPDEVSTHSPLMLKARAELNNYVLSIWSAG